MILKALPVTALALVCIFAPTAGAQAPDSTAPFLTGMCVRGGAVDTASYVESPAKPPAFKPGLSLPSYPYELRRPGYSGTVVIAFILEANGHMRDGSAAVISSDDPLLSAWACGAVKRLRMYPAEDGGKPVATQVVVPFTYQTYLKSSQSDTVRH